MSKLFEAMADIKLTTENIQKVIKMFPRDNDWKNLITKHRKDIDALRRGKDLPQKVEDELFNWALDNNEIKTDDVEELEDFIDSIMNEGTFEIAESVPKAVQGLNDLGNKMKGRDQKDIRRIEKLYRSGNKKVFQGAIRALDTDLRDQVKDIFDALDMVKNGVIESVDLDEGKMKRNPLIDNNPDVKAARKAHADGTWDGNVDKEGEAIVHIKGKPYTVTNKFESVDEGTLPPALQAYQDKKNGKKKKDDKDEDVKEHTISIDEQIIEALKAGKGKGVADIDYVGDPKLTKKIEKMFKVKIKQTGTTTADVTGEKKDILNFLQKHYYYDNSDVMDLYPEIVEANESTQMKKVSDMSERAMTLKQIAQKYKGEISKSQKSGNPDLYLKKAEKELVAWAMDNNEISGKDSDEEDDWLANVVSDKKQFDALLKFSRT